MTQPAPPQQQQQDGPSQAQVAALAVVLVGSAALVGMAAAFAALSGLPVAVCVTLLRATELGGGPGAPDGVLTRRVREAAASYRAAYLLNAASRIRASLARGASVREALSAELPNARAHMAAQANRRRAAAAADKVAARHGLVLGWRAVHDGRTSAECAAADGRNWRVDAPPAIGIPGAVHPRCRCKPVAAFAGAGWVGGSVSQSERKRAVA